MGPNPKFPNSEHSWHFSNSSEWPYFMIYLFTNLVLTLYIVTNVGIRTLSRVIPTYIISLATLPVLISISKINNFSNISRYSFNLSLNSLLT